MIADIEKTTVENMPDDSYSTLYLIHHMHHFVKGKTVSHELHHCRLYSMKNMKGKVFEVKHKFNNDVIHKVEPAFNGVLYDHANNKFVIKNSEIIV